MSEPSMTTHLSSKRAMEKRKARAKMGLEAADGPGNDGVE